MDGGDDGFLVGNMDGTKLGTADGAELGVLVAFGVGPELGFELIVGVELGSLAGLGAMDIDGLELGIVDGLMLGDVEGIVLGMPVGRFDGREDGLSVGADSTQLFPSKHLPTGQSHTVASLVSPTPLQTLLGPQNPYFRPTQRLGKSEMTKQQSAAPTTPPEFVHRSAWVVGELDGLAEGISVGADVVAGSTTQASPFQH